MELGVKDESHSLLLFPYGILFRWWVVSTYTSSCYGVQLNTLLMSVMSVGDKGRAWLDMSYNDSNSNTFVYWAEDFSKWILGSCFMESLTEEFGSFSSRQMILKAKWLFPWTVQTRIWLHKKLNNDNWSLVWLGNPSVEGNSIMQWP